MRRPRHDVTRMLLALMCLILGAWGMPGALAQTPETVVAITPLTGAQVYLGEEVTLAVEVQGAVDLYAVDVRTSFTPGIVAVTDLKPGDLPEPEFIIRRVRNNTTGTTWYATSQVRPTAPKSGDGVIHYLTFKGLTEGTAQLAITSYVGLGEFGEDRPAARLLGTTLTVLPARPTPTPGPEPTPTPPAIPTPQPGERAFGGHVWLGQPFDPGAPMPGVRVQLYGNDSPTALGTLLKETTTDATGAFALSTSDSYAYYNIWELTPDGYRSTGALAGEGGIKVTDDWVLYVDVGAGRYDPCAFWNELMPQEARERTFEGHVYLLVGSSEHTGEPKEGATVELYGYASNAPAVSGLQLNAADGVLLDTAVTGADGAFSLTTTEPYAHYALYDPIALDAEAGEWAVCLDEHWLLYPAVPGGVYGGNVFWERPGHKAEGPTTLWLPMVFRNSKPPGLRGAE